MRWVYRRERTDYGRGAVVEDMMELWISRAAMEMVVRAAVTFASTVDVPEVDTAIKTIQEAVKDAWEDPLDITLL